MEKMSSAIRKLAFALVFSTIGLVNPVHAQSENATKGDVKRLDHEIEMLKDKVSHLESMVTQHSTAAQPSHDPSHMMGKPGQDKGMPNQGMQGKGMGEPAMPMDHDMPMPNTNSGQQGSSGMGNMGDM